jgi:CRISPR-associated protein Cas2
VQRRRFLLAYDISDDRRLRRVLDIAKDFGFRLQYSVYLCDLDPMERVELRVVLRRTIDERVDRIAILDLGEIGRIDNTRWEFLGRRPGLPGSGARII